MWVQKGVRRQLATTYRSKIIKARSITTNREVYRRGSLYEVKSWQI